MVQPNGTKGDNAMSTNPYASPQTDCSQAGVAREEVVRREMGTAIRLYWWMGAISILFHSTVAGVVCIAWALEGSPVPEETAAGLIFIVVLVAVSAFSIHVANRLKTSPQGLLPRARLVGIIMATWWFPWLTVPGIICVRRITRRHTDWCDIVARANSTTNS